MVSVGVRLPCTCMRILTPVLNSHDQWQMKVVIAIGSRNRETIVHRLRRANWPMWAVVSGGWAWEGSRMVLLMLNGWSALQQGCSATSWHEGFADSLWQGPLEGGT